MPRPFYLWHRCYWQLLHLWKRGWSPAVWGEGGCDLGSSRMESMPGSWPLTPSSSPSPSPHVSDSTSCDYRGSGTWGGRWERIVLGKPTGCRRRERKQGEVSRQMVKKMSAWQEVVGKISSYHKPIRCTKRYNWDKACEPLTSVWAAASHLHSISQWECGRVPMTQCPAGVLNRETQLNILQQMNMTQEAFYIVLLKL